MNMRLIGAGGDGIDGAAWATMALRRMSPEQLLQLGINHVAYVLACMREGEPLFLIHGADGVPLATVEDLQQAAELAVEQGFAFVTVH